MEILSLWRSPIDKLAIAQAEALRDAQPRCSIGYDEDFTMMTIYNYGQYITAAGGIAYADSALTTMFSQMSPDLYYGNNGGTAFIPQQGFAVTVAQTVPDQCNIVGSGGGGYGGSSLTNFFHFLISPPGSGAFTFLTCTGTHTSGGKYFRGLAFQFVGSSNKSDTCIAAGTWNCRAINCTFTDCPLAFDTTNGGTANGLSCTLEQCTINYTQGPADATAIILGGPQDGVIGPGQLSQTSQASGGPSGCTCIAVQGPAEHSMIVDAQIYDWTFGIDFSQKDNSEYTNITNCEIECWETALNIAIPATANKGTAGVKVTSCTLAKTFDSGDQNPIANISTNGNTTAFLNDITLLDCTVFSMSPEPLNSNHGLAIAGGSNIKIIGGTYSGNGPVGGAGIAITGPCSDVQIISVNLQPSYPNAAPNFNKQQYALLVSGNPGDPVLVSGCDMTGYSGPPVSVTGAPVNLLITNCPGYNDQNTPLNGGMPPLVPVNAATCTTRYFGPSLFTWSNNTPVTVHVFGQTYIANSGIIFLPSPYDTFSMSIVPLVFSWVGK